MGSRRLGRKRLYALGKVGETLTSTAGGGIEGNIGTQSRVRQGELVTTDITIDLASSNGAANSFVTTGTGAGANKIIGVSSSSGTHSDAQIMQINKDAAAVDGIGLLVSAELICVEAPTTGEDNIGVWYATNASGSGNDMHVGGTELIPAQAMAVPKDSISADIDADLDNKYLYLVSSGSTATNTYGAGKFVLRLYGYNVFDDV